MGSNSWEILLFDIFDEREQKGLIDRNVGIRPSPFNPAVPPPLPKKKLNSLSESENRNVLYI